MDKEIVSFNTDVLRPHPRNSELFDDITGEKWSQFLESVKSYSGNLTNELDYEVIASKACVSSFYFQKVFSILCGYSVGEYIRNRKLTLAANEIIGGKAKIIDISMKYGYENPESFTRAYVRFHGISPTATKKQRAIVKSCSRLIVKVIMEGGSVIDYKIIEKEAFSTKYITFGISADGIGTARPRLERVEADILSNFKKLGVEARGLTGRERLEVLHDQLHPGGREPFRFSWDMIPQTGMERRGADREKQKFTIIKRDRTCPAS